MGEEMDKHFGESGVFEDPKFSYESNHLRSIFPEVVWIAILDRVKLLIPEDLENWSNSSPYFRYLLEDQRVTFLFPKVFEILAPKYEQKCIPPFLDKLKDNCYREDPVMIPVEFDDEGLATEWDWDWDQAHELTGIMKCRLVCRSWNKTIQNYYEDPQKPAGGTHFEMKYDRNRLQTNQSHSLDKIDLWKDYRFECECHEPVVTPFRFVEHFQATHNSKNPFMGRSLTIQSYMPQDYEEDGNLQLYFNGLDQVLRNFGDEVWYCAIKFNETVSDPRGYRTQLYSRLQGWLTMMPNLRSLKIVQDIFDREDEWSCLELLNESIPALLREIGHNPLPKLEHLEFLCVKNVLAPIFNELIHKNGHISGLEMERDEADKKVYKYDVDYVLSSMENLKRLGIHSLTEEDLIKLEDKIGDLRLEKFQLTDPKGFPFHWERLLGLLRGSSGTLTDLVLELPFVGNKEGRDLLELTKSQNVVGHLGRLERLLIFVGRPLFLDWLLSMKNNLKQLELVIPPYLERVKGYDKVVREQNIELFGFKAGMDKSNIWKAFEKLEVVKVLKGFLAPSESEYLECKLWEEFARPLKEGSKLSAEIYFAQFNQFVSSL